MSTFINKEIINSTTTSGNTINNYVYIDNSGNVTQINNKTPNRLKYYIDPVFDSQFVIGVDDETAMGLGSSLLAKVYYYEVKTDKSRSIKN